MATASKQQQFPIRIKQQRFDEETTRLVDELRKYYQNAIEQSEKDAAKDKTRIGRVPFPWDRK